MAFRPKKKAPRFADLKNTLAQSSKTDHALYTTIQEIIERLDHFRNDTSDRLEELDPTNLLKNTASKFASYHTRDDDSAILPNSVQILAGTGISFDDTIPNKRTISSTGGGGSNHYDCPLTDGDLVAADLIYAAGECIIVQVPI